MSKNPLTNHAIPRDVRPLETVTAYLHRVARANGVTITELKPLLPVPGDVIDVLAFYSGPIPPAKGAVIELADDHKPKVVLIDGEHKGKIVYAAEFEIPNLG